MWILWKHDSNSLYEVNALWTTRGGRRTSWSVYELVGLRVGRRTSWLAYELVCVRVGRRTTWPNCVRVGRHTYELTCFGHNSYPGQFVLVRLGVLGSAMFMLAHVHKHCRTINKKNPKSSMDKHWHGAFVWRACHCNVHVQWTWKSARIDYTLVHVRWPRRTLATKKHVLRIH